MSLTSRERVQLTLEHKEPDRIPVAIGASGAGVTDDVYFQLKKYLGIKGDVEPFRHGHGDNIYDPRVYDKLGGDFRHVFLMPSEEFVPKKFEDGSLENEYGIRVKKVNGMWEESGHPLSHASLIDLDNYPWPNPYKGNRSRNLISTAKDYFENTDFAVATRSPARGFFLTATQLRGFDRFMMDLVINKPFAHKLLGKISEVLCAYYDVLLDGIGDYIQIVETQDDLAHQKAAFISKEMFREFFMPYRKAVNQVIKDKAPKAKIQYHCCGAVRGLLDEFIECGSDILNPVQPLAKGMDMDELKRLYGKQIVFHGAIDAQFALAGSPEMVENEVIDKIKKLGHGGGYILAPGNVLQGDVPIENIVLLFEYAKKHGKYPINL